MNTYQHNSLCWWISQHSRHDHTTQPKLCPFPLIWKALPAPHTHFICWARLQIHRPGLPCFYFHIPLHLLRMLSSFPQAELRTLWSTFLCVSWAAIKARPGWFTKRTSVAYFSSGPWVPGKQCHAHCCTPRAGLGSKMSCQIPLVLQGLRIHPPMQETQEAQVLSLGQEDPLEREMATHSSILTWKISWTGEPGGLPSIGSQRVKTRLSNWACMRTHFPRDYQRIRQASTFILTRLQWLMCVYVAQSCLTLYNPRTVTSRLLSPWNFPGKITGVGCHFLLQRIFPIQDLTQVSRMAGRFFTVWATSLQWLELGSYRKSSGTFQSATVPTHPYCLHSAHLSQWCFLLGPAGIWVYNHRFRQICSV